MKIKLITIVLLSIGVSCIAVPVLANSGPNQDQPGSDGIGDTPYAFYGGEKKVYNYNIEDK